MPRTSPTAKVEPFSAWLLRVHDAINVDISKAHPHSWDEDYLTFVWLNRLLNDLNASVFTVQGATRKVKWKLHKARGRIEHAIGDVAVLVNLRLSQTVSVSGVGLLEAKRIAYNGKTFSKLDWSQLHRQSARYPSHRLLLYDFAPIVAVPNLHLQKFCFDGGSEPFGSTLASVVPSHHVLALKSRDRSLGSFGLPLAYQIGARYLNGFDLEYDEDLIARIIEQRDRQSRRKQPPSVKFILTADVNPLGGTGSGEPAPIRPNHILNTLELIKSVPMVNVISATKTQAAMCTDLVVEEKVLKASHSATENTKIPALLSPPEILGE